MCFNLVSVNISRWLFTTMRKEVAQSFKNEAQLLSRFYFK